MQHFFIKENQINNGKVKIIGKDVNHIKNVLRCRLNEEIEVSVLESAKKYVVKIVELNEDNILCEVIEEVIENTESNVEINIIQGLPKADKMELIIQKCTELGVKEITPFELSRCVVKLNGKDVAKKIARWEGIAEAAAKQCGRNCVTKINGLYNLKNISEVLKDKDLVIVAYEGEKNVGLKEILNELKFKNLQKELSFAALDNFKEHKNGVSNECTKNFEENKTNEKIKVAIVVGPEGGFEEKEVEELKTMGAKSVTLGKRILRTETVAIALTSVVMYELGDFGEK